MASKLKKADFRVKVDEGNDSFSKKIRNAEMMKVPYILIVGEKEESANEVSVREFRSKKQYVLGVEELMKQVEEERSKRKLASEH